MTKAGSHQDDLLFLFRSKSHRRLISRSSAMRTSPSIAPHGPDQDTYLALSDFGPSFIGRAWRETGRRRRRPQDADPRFAGGRVQCASSPSIPLEPQASGDEPADGGIRLGCPYQQSARRTLAVMSALMGRPNMCRSPVMSPKPLMRHKPARVVPLSHVCAVEEPNSVGMVGWSSRPR